MSETDVKNKSAAGENIYRRSKEDKDAISESSGNASNPQSVPSDLSTKPREPEGLSSVVAAHYNTLEEKGLAERFKSRIFYLRNFNNWIKSMLINEFMSKIQQNSNSPIRVLDMGCGKGGDLLKWKRANIGHLICADLAEVSIQQCQGRYRELETRNSNDRGSLTPIFTAEFFAADCTRIRISERFKDPSMRIDLTSCQFTFHYCFESLPQAECMLRNAAERLRPGGFFIGSIPDAYEIVSRLKSCQRKSFGNDVFRIEFECDTTKPLPLFGAKYNFHLEEVVDCPEFLVHFPTLVRLAEKFDLKLVLKERFQDFYNRYKEEGRSLLAKMQALETYPPYHDSPLLGTDSTDYEHISKYMQTSTGHRKVGTLSKSEWEAATLYLVFAFQKVDPRQVAKKSDSVGKSSDADGKHLQ